VLVRSPHNTTTAPDYNTPLQKNRAIIGHNLKIAWNLMRIHHLRASKRYEECACKIADIMPRVGMDRQRGGWYDMAERLSGLEKSSIVSSGTIAKRGGNKSKAFWPTSHPGRIAQKCRIHAPGA
jgi:hypothetical protein